MNWQPATLSRLGTGDFSGIARVARGRVARGLPPGGKRLYAAAMTDLPEPVPAATLVLMRERAAAPPELLVMERTGHMAFAAGALVFPGGRIDREDREAAAAFPGLDDAAARIAAVRETIEETGIA